MHKVTAWLIVFGLGSVALMVGCYMQGGIQALGVAITVIGAILIVAAVLALIWEAM